MKANDTFSYIVNNQLTANEQSLARLYLPIMGNDAFALYHYFLAFFDNGQKSYLFSHLLNHLQFGMQVFQESLAILTALDLVAFYYEGNAYKLLLKSPLSVEDFLANDVLSKLLEQRIGERALVALTPVLPNDLTNLSKSFAEVFSDKGEISFKPAKSKIDFDWDNFRSRMQKDGLKFADEQKDLIAIYNLSERFHLNWFATYQLAKETAYQKIIQPKRMLAKKEQKSPEAIAQFSAGEKEIITEVKKYDPQAMLAKLKKAKKAKIVDSERKLIQQLVEQNLLDEVINLLMIYSLGKTDSANLNNNYLLKLANDCAYKGLNSAEAVMAYLRQEPVVAKTKSKAKTKSSQSVPTWSNPNYQNQTSQNEQTKLEALKRNRLDQLRKED